MSKEEVVAKVKDVLTSQEWLALGNGMTKMGLMYLHASEAAKVGDGAAFIETMALNNDEEIQASYPLMGRILAVLGVVDGGVGQLVEQMIAPRTESS